MIDIIISYLFRKVNIAFSVLSDQCIVLSRGTHLACADNVTDRIKPCRERLPTGAATLCPSDISLHCRESPSAFRKYAANNTDPCKAAFSVHGFTLLKSLGAGRR